MVTTADNERRKAYKRLWYRKKKANDSGDAYMVQFYEDQMDDIREIKRNPEARKKQLQKRAKKNARLYQIKKDRGYFRDKARQYRRNNRALCSKRDKIYRNNLSPQKYAKVLKRHRLWNRKHSTVIRKRALLYAENHRKRARKIAKRWYYNHKKKVNNNE